MLHTSNSFNSIFKHFVIREKNIYYNRLMVFATREHLIKVIAVKATILIEIVAAIEVMFFF